MRVINIVGDNLISKKKPLGMETLVDLMLNLWGSWKNIKYSQAENLYCMNQKIRNT